MIGTRKLGQRVASCAILLLLIQTTFSEVVRVETALNGNKLELVELEVTSGNNASFPNRMVPFSSLITTNVIDFLSVAESNATNTITVLATPDSTSPLGDDRLLLLGDPYLNTGIFNPAYGTPGIHIEFQRGVVNGPGVDFVAFELTIGSGQTPDPIEILLSGDAAQGLNIVSADYQLQGAIPAEAAPRTFEVSVNSGGTAKFAALRDSSLNLVGATTNPKWHAISIDLDSLGVPEWGTINELFLLSDNASRNTPVDLLMVAGLPPVYRPGDFDGDFDVDGQDFLVWQREYGNGFGSPADGTQDGAVDAGDLALWQQYYQGTSLAAISAVVPEPSPLMAALVLAFGPIALTRRR
jgi:hypothetical protein